MKILLVSEHRNNGGNTHALVNCMRVGDALGHTMAFFGQPQAQLPGVRFSTDVGAFDRILYLFESKLYSVERLCEVTMLASVPRAHRFVLDSDAKYNPMLVIDGYDRNHANEAQRVAWMNVYEALSDRILVPSLSPPGDERVINLPFYGYDPSLLVTPETAPPKRYDVLYVGHNWWRWKELHDEILPGLEQIRDEIGEIGFVGEWWDGPPGDCDSELGSAFWLDEEAFRRLRIRRAPAVPYTDVIRTMSTGRINLFLQRPILAHVKYLTLRYFEEFCADTIPLLMLDTDLAVAVYGPAARELTLPGRVAKKVLDALRRPQHYREIVEEVRQHLFTHHRYHERVEELISILEG